MTFPTTNPVDARDIQQYEHETTPKAKRTLLVDATGTAISAANPLAVDATIETGDIELGAVEIKNATDDTRAVVKSDGTNNALVVVQNTVPSTTVTATHLDIRHLNATDDALVVSQSTATNLNANVSATHLDIRHLNTTDDAVNVGTVTTLPSITGTVTVTGVATSANQQPASSAITSYNITLTNANTEYSQLLTTGTKELRFRCRTNYDVRYAWVTGKVAGSTAPYLTLPAGCDYILSEVSLTSKTIYLASAQAGVIVEVEEWS